MARRRTRSAGYMSNGEQVAGTAFFLIYLVVLPFVMGPLFRLVGRLLDITVSETVQNIYYYYALFVVTVIIFHGFLARTSRALMDNLGEACKTVVLGLIALYGLNELVYRITDLMTASPSNLNDVSIASRVGTAPWTTVIIVVFLAPFVEETLFRGLVFGNLKDKSRPVAYLVSCLLFALFHVWQFAVGQQDVSYLVLTIQYLVPGLVLAWAYENSGTLWTPIAIHAVANGLALLSMNR